MRTTTLALIAMLAIPVLATAETGPWQSRREGSRDRGSFSGGNRPGGAEWGSGRGRGFAGMRSRMKSKGPGRRHPGSAPGRFRGGSSGREAWKARAAGGHRPGACAAGKRGRGRGPGRHHRRR